MRHIIAILVAIGSLVMGFRALLADSESPTYRLVRAFTVEDPRCLICNRPALVARTFQHYPDRHGRHGIEVDHPMCAQHAGSNIVYFTWPNVDKYVLMVGSIGFYLAAIVAGLAGVVSVFAGGGLATSFAAPVLFYLGTVNSDLMTRFV